MKKLSILASLLLGLSVISVSCQMGNSSTPEDEIRGFAKYFVEKATAGQIDSIKPFYPELAKANSLVDLQSDTIIVKEAAPGEFDVKLTDDVTLKVARDENDYIKITESRGLFAYPEANLEIAKKTGLWTDKLTDAELANRMADHGFFAYIYSKANKIKDNLLTVSEKFVDTTTPADYPTDDPDEIMYYEGHMGVGYRTITNNTDQPFGPSDYKMEFRNENAEFMNPNPVIKKDSKPGKEIAPHETIRVKGSWFHGGTGHYEETDHLVGVTILLTQEDIMNRFMKFTGNEYQEYLHKK